VRSVCTGCARGCSIKVWRRKKLREPRMPGTEQKNEAYRITAFENPEINGPWLCNKGFDLHHWMARERLPHPLVGGQPATIEEALATARRLLSGAKRPAVLVSAHASNEELDAFAARLGARVEVYAHEDCVPLPGEVLEDHLLIRADKNPNRKGVEARFGWRPFDGAAGHDVVLVWGEIGAPLALGAACWIHLTPFATPDQPSAAVAIPISSTFERCGSFTNFEGKRNEFEAVFAKPRLVEDAAEVFGRLAW
jgi:NADH-quinone oxidoreductase subunit G